MNARKRQIFITDKAVNNAVGKQGQYLRELISKNYQIQYVIPHE